MTKFNHFQNLGRMESIIALPNDFPVSGGKLHRQGDADITALHYHQCLELGYCYEGSGIFMINDRVYNFTAGDASLIKENDFHLAQSSRGTVSQWRFISLDLQALVQFFSVSNSALVKEWYVTMQSGVLKRSTMLCSVNLIQEILEEYLQQNSFYEQLFCLKLCELLLQNLREIQGGGLRAMSSFDSSAFRRVLPAIEWIFHHYNEPIKIERLADLCNLSLAQFRRVFSLAVGSSPQQYLMMVRLQHAEQLLQTTDLKIIDIAQGVGFSTLSAFHRAFRLFKNSSPKMFKK